MECGTATLSPDTVQSNTYDEVPYPSYPYAASHPDRLYNIAKLFGLEPQRPDGARILELGCASGGNILPMASQFGDADFVGVDLSSCQIDVAQEVIDTCGLENVELVNASIADIDASFGKFDFILCHGVYSWVPSVVQQEILRVCGRQLNESGVCYVSYNTLPGWYMRGAIRGMMLKHVETHVDSRERLLQSRALLQFLAEATASQNTPYAKFLSNEASMLKTQLDGYLYHDHLEEHNQPVFFCDFIKSASEFGLQFLGESQLASMWTGNIAEPTRSKLLALTDDIVLLGQYSDYISNRTFRQTILCHSQSQIDRNLTLDRIRTANFRGRFYSARDAGLSYEDGSELTYITMNDQSLSTASPILKGILRTLDRAFPEVLEFSEIASVVKDELRETLTANQSVIEATDTVIAKQLLELVLGGVIEFSYCPQRYSVRVAETPRTTSLARLQAARGTEITNLRHERISISEGTRWILQLLDGTKNRNELVAVGLQLIERGEVGSLLRDFLDTNERTEYLARAVDRALDGFARNALLV